MQGASQRNLRKAIGINERKSAEEIKAQAFTNKTLTSRQEYGVPKLSQNSSTTTREPEHSNGTR
ncbi:hypothetical protein ANCCAN_12898 [Ancylostoma caninum]|uniref:Uncharacterized protein n=1 Tax=Ancylostoma caninum TaxID=29170 RepID=A0A368G9S4_ANCCA|nr:hypothetical protein ANCCAN_12898 [Ancylostoma caninum]